LNILKWIQNWYLQNCDEDWEHCYGVNISTLDNPGWMVDIDLTNTSLENKEFRIVDIERNAKEISYDVELKEDDRIDEGFPVMRVVWFRRRI
jgi:hypothetical protein